MHSLIVLSVKNDDWRKKWLNELIKEIDNVLYPNARYLLIFLGTFPVQQLLLKEVSVNCRELKVIVGLQ